MAVGTGKGNNTEFRFLASYRFSINLLIKFATGSISDV